MTVEKYADREVNYNRPKRPLHQGSAIAEQAAVIGSTLRGHEKLAARHMGRAHTIDKDVEADKTLEHSPFAFR